MILLLASLAITLAVSVPFASALVRFRAHYNPKGLRLDPEGGVQPRAGLAITSFFAMLVRIYRIEVRVTTLLSYSCTIKLVTNRDGQDCTGDSVCLVFDELARNH